MRQRWEYLTLVRRYETDLTNPLQQSWTESFWIFQPGDNQGQRREAHSGSSTNPEYKVTILDILGELGAEGWELVSETVLETTVIASGLGWKDVGMPTSTRWVFKRPAED